MANDVLQTRPENSVTGLIGGIVQDVEDLLKQQLVLFKAELSSDLTKAKEAAVSMALGVGVLLGGAGLLCLMLVFALHEYTPIPLWGCFGIVGGVLAVAGVALLYAGKARIESMPGLQESARQLEKNVQTLKTDVQTLVNPK